MAFFPSMVTGFLILVAVLWVKLDDWIPESQLEGSSTIAYEVRWKEWCPGLVELCRKKGQIVFLVFTSDWDLTHLVNKERIFKNQKVLKMMAEYQIILIKADLTDRSPAIQNELERYGRTYLPTTVVAPGDPDAPAILLPELVGPEDVIEALEQAAKETEGRSWFGLKGPFAAGK